MNPFSSWICINPIADHLILVLATGNAKANQYWESELPQHFERSSSDTFIRAKYWFFSMLESVCLCCFLIFYNTTLAWIFSSSVCVCFRYSEKRWVSPGGIQPAPIVSQLSCKVSHLVESGYKPETPKKARTLSLDEEILLHHVLQVTPPETRTRAVWYLTKFTF